METPHEEKSKNIINGIEEIQEKLKSTQLILNEGKFDEAIESYRICCEKAREYYKDDMHHEMAIFYYFYGDAVLYKIEESEEIFGEVIEKAENNKNDVIEENPEEDFSEKEDPKTEKRDSLLLLEDNVIFIDKDIKIIDETTSTTRTLETETKIIQNTENFPSEINDSAINNPELIPLDNLKGNEQKNEDVEFLQIAWENLEVARVITDKRYQEIINSKECDKKEVEKLLKQKSRIYLRLGDLECWKENFEEGLNEYKTALEIRLKFENPRMSRDISEIHFLIGNVYLYIGKDNCEEKALSSYKEAKQILENNLKKELGILTDNQSFFGIPQEFDRNLINESVLDSDKAKDLKFTLKMLYDKIEDTMQQISEKNIFNLEKEKMKENILKENHFEQKKLNSSNPQENSNNKENVMTSFPNPNMGKEKDDVKIVNLGVFGNSRKRPVGIISQNPLACEVTKAELEDIAHNDKKTKIT